MFRTHSLSYLLVVVLLTGSVFAQEAPPTMPAGPDPNQPAAESVYKRIPADCMGFIAAKNLNGLLENITVFADQIGMGEQIKQTGGLLPMMAMMLQLGEGYNPNGGVAAVLLDFEKCGIDVDEMLRGQAGQIPPPLVILLAGKSIETTFPTQAQKAEDGTMTVMLPMGDLPPMQAIQVGDYIAMSPNPQALALMKTGKSVAEALPPEQKKVLADSDVVFHENLVTITPFIRKMVASAEKKAQAAAEDSAPVMMEEQLMGRMMDPIVDMLDDILSLSYGLQFVDDGMMILCAEDFKAGSKLGNLVQAYKPSDKPMMNLLPNPPYVLAGGMEYTHDPEYSKIMMKMLEMLLALGDLEMPADLKERMLALSDKMGKDVNAVQFIGCAPKGKGVFGLGMVVACNNADETKALLPQKVELLTELIQKTVAVKEEDLADLSFTYQENVDTIDATVVDAIVVDSKELQELDDDEKKEMTDVFTEAQIRFLLAKADDKTLVVTLGGGKEFLATSLQAARDGGTIASDPGVARALAKLPSRRVAVMVFSPKNMFDAVQAGMKKVGEESDLPEGFAFESSVPMALSSTVQGTTVLGTMYIPSSSVKDIVAWAMAEAASAAETMPAPGGQMPPPASPAKSAPAKKGEAAE